MIAVLPEGEKHWGSRSLWFNAIKTTAIIIILLLLQPLPLYLTNEPAVIGPQYWRLWEWGWEDPLHDNDVRLSVKNLF